MNLYELLLEIIGVKVMVEYVWEFVNDERVLFVIFNSLNFFLFFKDFNLD